MNVVPIDRAVLDDADKGLIIHPRHANEASAGVFPDGLSDLDARGVEDAEFAEGGFGVELDDLGIVADHGDWTTEGCAGDLVAAEVDVFPLHLVELGLTIVAVVEELPLRGN